MKAAFTDLEKYLERGEKGTSQVIKMVKKETLSALGNSPPPKRVKSGHLLSDYQQKCVNATRDILMSKARKIIKNQTPWTHWIKSDLKGLKMTKKM